MAEKKPKTYVRGSAKKFEFPNGGSVINLSFNIENLSQFADENGWVRLVCSERSSVDDYGNTHSVYVNEWKPEAKAEAKKEEDDLPF